MIINMSDHVSYPIRLQTLIDQNPHRFWNLQRYIDDPPGEGMAIIYVELFPSNKMYVGQHCHGKTGKSYSKTRMFKHDNCSACKNAYEKYGTDNVRVFIIDHCRAGKRHILPSPDDSNGLEQFYISAEGLDTLSPNGYNLQIGGFGGPMHPDTIAKLKIIKNDPVVKEKTSKSLKKTMSTVEYREKQSEAAKKRWEDEDYRKKHAEAMKISKADPEYRKKHAEAMKNPLTLQRQSEAAKKRWEDEDYRKKHTEAMKISKADPEYLQRQSEAAKKKWEDEDYRNKHAEGMKQLKKAKRQRMNDLLLPAIRLAFEKLWNDHGNVNATKGIEINGRNMGNLCRKIRGRFDYVRHCPELAAYLKERGFKMDTRDEVKNAQKWAELERKQSVQED
jgi:hypothetical protein